MLTILYILTLVLIMIDSLANDTELFTSLTQQPNEIVSKEELNEIVNTEEPNEIVNTEEIITTEQPNEMVTTEQPELIVEVSTSDQLHIITICLV